MNKINNICYYISIFVIILGIVMTAMSLVVILPSGITTESMIIPGLFLLLTVLGIFFAVFYKKRIKGDK